jgi:hypothetical protein
MCIEAKSERVEKAGKKREKAHIKTTEQKKIQKIAAAFFAEPPPVSIFVSPVSALAVRNKNNRILGAEKSCRLHRQA